MTKWWTWKRVTTGFRQTEFKGGAGTGGVYLNGQFVWLTGYAQRASDDWAGLGEAYPDWMHDYNAQLIRSAHANYIRWMHIAPQAVDVRASIARHRGNLPGRRQGEGRRPAASGNSGWR